MSRFRWLVLVVLIVVGGIALADRLRHSQTSPSASEEGATIAARIPPPPGYAFLPTEPGSFAEWLTRLPLKPGRPPVLLYDGRPKSNQSAHHAVIDIDVGEDDLQQCADAIIRLRAEYLWAAGRTFAIRFNFTNGAPAHYSRWQEGWRPVVLGNTVRWSQRARPNSSYACFRDYLDTVFTYAGTLSLSQELSRVQIDDMQIGDVFIRGGSPGHAAIVVNMAVHPETGKRVFLLAQSYMPAQDIHVLRNPTDADLSPWYPLDFGDQLQTPEFTFNAGELRRF